MEKEITDHHESENEKPENSDGALRNRQTDSHQNFPGKRVVVVFGIGNFNSPQTLAERRQNADGTIFARPHFNQPAPDELMAEHGNGEEKMKRNFIRPPSRRNEKQTTPKAHDAVMGKINELS